MEIAISAIILHDVGWKMVPEKLHLTAFGHNPSNPKLVRVHELEGEKIAKGILEKLHFPPEKANEISRIVQGHDTRKRPISASDRIVKDADKLWRYSRRGVKVETKRFNVPRSIYLDFLEKIINEWFLTPTARGLAKKEMSSRRYEKE